MFSKSVYNSYIKLYNFIVMKTKVNFKSKPLFEKTNLNDFVNHNSKYILLLFIYTILVICMCVLLGIGFNPNDINTSLELVPENIQIMRGISIFLIAWTIFIFSWILKLTIENCKANTIKKEWFRILFFIPIVNIYTFYVLFSFIPFSKFWLWFSNGFKTDKELYYLNSRKQLIYYISIGVLFIMTPVAVMVWILPENSSSSGLNDTWFEGIHYFTLQTNLLCWVLVLTYVINPAFKIFKSKTWFQICTCNIAIVSITYLAGLLPINIIDGSTNDWSDYTWAKTMWEHAVNPIIFISFSMFYILFKKEILVLDYLTSLKYSMVIPTVYLFYVTCLPFVCNDSVYGFITNCNPNLPNSAGSIISHGEWYIFFIIVAYWFVFIAILTLLWYIKEKMRLKYEQLSRQKQEQQIESKQLL